jgi:hypothetical protein
MTESILHKFFNIIIEGGYMKKIITLCFIIINIIGFISLLVSSQWKSPFIRDNEFLIDTSVIYVPGIGNAPDVGFDGTNYLCVWEDDRNGNFKSIFGARVDQSGILVDSATIPISNIPINQKTPAIIFKDSLYLAVWSDFRNGTYDIYAARINTYGEVIDSTDILISSSTYDLVTPSVTLGGNYFFVVWKEQFSPTNGNICGARIDISGNVIDTSAIIINASAIAYESPDVSFDGKNFFAVWTIATHAYGARIDTGGTVIDSTNILIAPNPGTKMNPNVLFNGDNYLTIWQDNRNSSYDIYGVRVDTSGEVLDSTAISIITSSNSLEYPHIERYNSHYFVVWEEIENSSHQIYGARLDSSFAVMDTGGIKISEDTGEQVEPSLILGEEYLFTVWSEMVGPILAARVDTAGSVLDSNSINISTSVFSQWYSACSFGGTNHLCVWEDKRNGEDYNIYGARVDTSGNVLDPECIHISDAPVNQNFPRLAFSGSNYLVVWEDERYSDIYGTRVDLSGTVLEPSGFRVGGAQWKQESPDITYGSQNYFVVWNDWRNSSGSGIYSTRVTASGAVLNPQGVIISYTDGLEDLYPRVGFNDSNYFVVWYRGNNILYGALVDTSIQVIDSTTISQDILHLTHPSIASDGSGYFIVWLNQDLDIYGARIDSSGTLLDTTAIFISSTSGKQSNPEVTFDGNTYVVLWEDFRHPETDIYGARVSTDGTVINTFPVISQPGNQFQPASVKSTGDNLLVTYSGFTDSINGRPVNTIHIWGTLFTPPVGIEEKESISTYSHFLLKQNRPNPVVSETNISYYIPGKSPTSVELSIYDITGRKVKTVVQTVQSPGHHTVRWNGKNHKGAKVPAGIYFYSLKTGKNNVVKKMVVIR